MEGVERGRIRDGESPEDAFTESETFNRSYFLRQRSEQETNNRPRPHQYPEVLQNSIGGEISGEDCLSGGGNLPTTNYRRF